jgi:hypothetical protein
VDDYLVMEFKERSETIFLQYVSRLYLGFPSSEKIGGSEKDG